MTPMTEKKDKVLLIEEVESSTTVLTFNRPHVLNALDRDLTHSLYETLQKLAEDQTVKAVILRGSGGNFMAGGDINLFKEALDLPAVERHDYFYQLVGYVNDMIRLLVEMPKPVISCVEGVAAGFGVSLALQGDYVLASPQASFAMAYNQMGLSPDGGASFLIPRAIGNLRARALFASGASLSAKEALQHGIVTDMVENTFEHAKKTARQLQSLPQEALVQTRALLMEKDAFYAHLELERHAFATCAATQDFADRVKAFLSKRKAS